MKGKALIISTLMLLAACMPKQPAPGLPANTGEASQTNVSTRESVVTVMDYGKDMLNNLKPGEALNSEYSEKMYAYVFSVPLKNQAEIAEFIKEIKNTSVLYVTQTAEGKYFVISYEGKSEQQLVKELPGFIATLPSTIDRDEIKVLSLSGFCAGSERLLKSQNAIICAKHIQLPCFTCTR